MNIWPHFYTKVKMSEVLQPACLNSSKRMCNEWNSCLAIILQYFGIHNMTQFHIFSRFLGSSQNSSQR